MTPTEATTLARITRAACPQQHFDEFTPDIWFDLLGDLDFEDCRRALLAAARARPFVAPAEIRAEVLRMRRERSKGFVTPPPADPDDELGYRRQLRAATKAAASPRPAGLLALDAAGDATTRARAAQLREHGGHLIDPAADADRPDPRPASVRDALAAARTACTQRTQDLHGDDPDALTPTEAAARQRAAAEKARQGLRRDRTRAATAGRGLAPITTADIRRTLGAPDA